MQFPPLLHQASVQHVCDWRCSVTHEFGNLYKCHTSGLAHVCDANCTQRLYNDKYSSICRVSKKLFPPMPELDAMDCAEPVSRKREGDEGQGSWKRTRNGATEVLG